MNKKLAFLCVVVISVFPLSGCINSKEFEQLQKENESLKSQIELLQNDMSYKDNSITSLNEQIEILSSEMENSNNEHKKQIEEYLKKIDELENSASRLLSDINSAFESKDYNKVINIANTLHKKHNGTEEDIKGQNISKQAQSELDKIKKQKEEENERKAAEAAKTAEQKVHDVIRIFDYYVYDINSVGGVDIYIAWQNKSPKTVKYITFHVFPYNAVDDLVRCTITGDAGQLLKCTGPYATGEGEYEYSEYSQKWYGAFWEALWYNNTVDRFEIDYIEIEYIDGTKVSLKGDDMKYVKW